MITSSSERDNYHRRFETCRHHTTHTTEQTNLATDQLLLSLTENTNSGIPSPTLHSTVLKGFTVCKTSNHVITLPQLRADPTLRHSFLSSISPPCVNSSVASTNISIQLDQPLENHKHSNDVTLTRVPQVRKPHL